MPSYPILPPSSSIRRSHAISAPQTAASSFSFLASCFLPRPVSALEPGRMGLPVICLFLYCALPADWRQAPNREACLPPSIWHPLRPASTDTAPQLPALFPAAAAHRPYKNHSHPAVPSDGPPPFRTRQRLPFPLLLPPALSPYGNILPLPVQLHRGPPDNFPDIPEPFL